MYKPHNLPNRALELIAMAGAGVKGSHDIFTASKPFVGSKTKLVYAIETYSDGVTFTTLKEGGLSNVNSARLDPGGNGYPERAVITGRFTAITPAGDGVVAGFVIEIE